MNEQRTQFDYLLNAMELAAAGAHPSQEGYGEKRALRNNLLKRA